MAENGAPRRVALITGAARRIGAAIARRLHAAGWDVALHCRRSRKELDALIAELERARASSALALHADLDDVDALAPLVAKTVERFGGLDALVNNAGIVDAKARVDEMSVERLERMMRINVVGSFLCAREAVKRMSTKHGGKGGVIVNVSSVAATLGSAGDYVDYAASKGAIDTMTIGLAREVATEGVRVNAVRPGMVETEIHASGGQPDRVARLAGSIPMHRAGKSEEIAEAILWFLSDAASYATGSLLTVSGGR
jgi:NAD(P)-dependent dehydrogenase (short-subunit alcohol dehydrogenase family)